MHLHGLVEHIELSAKFLTMIKPRWIILCECENMKNGKVYLFARMYCRFLKVAMIN
jgi:hypothetical protein